MTAERISSNKEKLGAVVATVTIPTPCSGSEGNWTFYDPEHPRDRIHSLHEAFSELRGRVPQRSATFLDCGSGNGVATLIAHLANFDRAYGIEKNEELVGDARRRLSSLVNQRIIPSYAVRFAYGSYYQPDILPDITARCMDKLHGLYDIEGQFETPDFTHYAHSVLQIDENGNMPRPMEDLLKAYLFPGSVALDELGIVSGRKLTADVSYIYPSDIFFECVFLPQMGLLMQEGSLLVVLSPVDDCILTPPPLFHGEKPILLSDCSDVPMCLQVFRKE
ncbi:MAG: hypothetical protein Q7S60_04225 [bacterium]|nr:hypothetical protein [bacterium]